jgi:oxygen-independent coproporphyrinogen-3 oxidase
MIEFCAIVEGPVSELGLYIHYPYCRKLCPYCDFAVAVAPRAGIPHQRYLEAVLAELAERAPALADRTLVSVYFGGGTPSLWPADCLAAVIRAARNQLAAAGELEITLEANPRDCTAETMAGWREAGVNRLSIGVQSVDSGELALLGRDHRQGDGRAALAAALGAGFRSISADVILGAPAGGRGLDSAVALAEAGPPHLSVYELTIEPATSFGKWRRSGRLVPTDDDRLAALYLEADRELTRRGYEHYEISSYARPGHRAVHNSLYWHGGDYLGIGAGAASFVRRPDGGGVRATNLRSAAAYLRARGDDRVAEVDPVAPAELAAEQLWLALRTRRGADPAAFAGSGRLLDQLLADRLVERVAGRIRPTIRGFLFHDRIARAIVGAGVGAER